MKGQVMPTKNIPPSFRSPRFAAVLLFTVAIAVPIVIASNRSAIGSRKPKGSSNSLMPFREPNGSPKRENRADQMAQLFVPQLGHDTSPRLRDMVQVPVTPNEKGLGQSIRAQEAITRRVAGSGKILVAGISADTEGEVGAIQRIKIAKNGYQIFDNRTGTSVLGPSDISTIWAGFGGSCEIGGGGG
ncbi:MAG TPA: hypothetical protein DC054_11735, partial [Blastocatellia bacterium]|nr:hypothetical protein [Blastocatellia bacterium]